MNSARTITEAPLRHWIGALAFLLPLLSLVTLFGISLVSFLFLGSGLILFKPSRDALVRHWPQVRWVVLAFLLHFLFVLTCALLRGASMSSVEKPARMLLAAALAGMFVVLGYLGFGLTEVIFWFVKGSLFYALMVFLLMGFRLNAKEKIG